MLISDDTYSADKIRIWKKTLGDSLQPWILEWDIIWGQRLRGMERGIWFESDKKENSAWQSDQLFYQFAGRRV